MSNQEELITYEVQGKAAIITLNNPKKLNSLTIPQYDEICKYLENANEHPETIITLIQSTGRAFSAGANAEYIGKQDSEIETWLNLSVARQTYLVQTILNHKKVLAVAMNGFAIGLSAAMVALCDLIYVHDLSKTFLLAPFTNIGIVAEGGTSVTLLNRLGWSKSAEALLLSKRITGSDMLRTGMINKDYGGKFSTTNEFNETVLKELLDAIENLHPDSILQNKQLLKAMYKPTISAANSQEVYRGLKHWTSGIPMERFKKLTSGELKHKM
ncbi:ECI1 [Candida oxycetoniae]|uniref:ECI1 n=1 Tax=Candida oxycetoniae TaxID=497107 RepID=A0AAI9WVP1_9ASCO|nr:ECI1 [Candida oxycetoniae]KAI3402315.1 ECI1 [Candida oxycetoniae]